MPLPSFPTTATPQASLLLAARPQMPLSPDDRQTTVLNE